MRSLARSGWWLAAAVVTIAGPALAERPRPFFRDATAEVGLVYTQHSPVEAPDCIFDLGGPGAFCEPERMTGGAAVGRVNGDRLPDLFVTRLDAPDLLFLNRKSHFEEASAAAGLADYDLQSNGAAFADVDGDGDLDLYVTTLGEAGDPVNDRNYLFINDGSGRFREEAVERGAAIRSAAARRGQSVAFGDFDRDGWIDLHVTEWLPFLASHSRLLRNRGAEAPGHFEDVTVRADVGLQFSDGFASTFTDLDRDGWPDLAVAADFGTSRLFWNRGDGTFEDGTSAAGVGTDENGMGSTFGDFDGDGLLDWFVTSIFDADRTCDRIGCNWGYTGNRLYRNRGDRTFEDATDAAGVRNGFWGWGTVFFDYDNDGDLDLVMTNGVDFPGTEAETAFHDDPMRLWENDGTGRMTEVSAEAGLTDTASGKGLLVFDPDVDGDLDLLVVNNAGAPRFYRNEGGHRSRWLRVHTVGTAPNTEGLGAWVRVTAADGSTQVREIGTSSHFLGQSERTAHFGIPKRSDQKANGVAEVRIEWPGGAVQTFSDVPMNQTLVAEQPTPVCGGLEPAALSLLFAVPAWRRLTTARPTGWKTRRATGRRRPGRHPASARRRRHGRDDRGRAAGRDRHLHPANARHRWRRARHGGGHRGRHHEPLR